MPHLVSPLPTPMSTQAALDLVRDAHDYLAQHGAQALQSAGDLAAAAHWGTQMKRLRVLFPAGNRLMLIATTLDDHNLTEVYNQCATIERLIDALTWAVHELPDYHVIRCHSSTSSDKTTDAVWDNDLILQHANGATARFEVSDVANSESDSNQKEFKDLTSLGVLASGKAATRYQIEQFPAGRLFLVVSTEFAKRLRKRSAGYPAKNPHYRYHEYPVSDWTVLFEVLPAK